MFTERKYFNYVVRFLLAISMLPIFTPVVSASANDAGNNNLESAKVEEVANMLEFMYEEATIKDESGDIVNLDFEKIKEKYGDSEDLAELEQIMTKKNNGSSKFRSSWTDCMLEALKDFLGVSAVGSLISGGIIALFKKKAWTAAAKLIIKTFGAQFTVVALAGTLAYFSVKCY